MTFSFHPRAEQELDKAVRYYEECSSGLGLEFAEEVYAAIARIIAYSFRAFKLHEKSSI